MGIIACGSASPPSCEAANGYILLGMDYWKNKVVLVTGGSSGLGRVIAEAFAAGGAKLVIVGLEADAVRTEPPTKCEPPAATHSASMPISPGRKTWIGCSPKRWSRFGRLDVLVNNAGRSMRGKVLDTTPEQFRELMELNLIALVRCTRAAVPHLLAAARATW